MARTTFVAQIEYRDARSRKRYAQVELDAADLRKLTQPGSAVHEEVLEENGFLVDAEMDAQMLATPDVGSWND